MAGSSTKKKSGKAKATLVAAAPAPAAGAASVRARVRMYRVGFGDFFLLTVFDAGGGEHHVLIDCGVHAANLGLIDKAIDQLAIDTGGKLALVIMTHRHADHISGFGSGKDVFAGFEVERVWMSSFENPKDGKAMAFQANLAALAGELGARLAARGGDDDEHLGAMMTNITGGPGVAGLSGNALALDVLHNGFKTQAPVDYYSAGDRPILPEGLAAAGVTAQILGPPTDPGLIAEMDGKAHQYLDAVRAAPQDVPPPPFAPRFRVNEGAYPGTAFEMFDPDRIEARIRANQPDLLAAAAKQADNTLNNQSLVVLFTVAGKTLLFAGDAQWGNWQNFLFGGEFGTPGHTGLTADSQAILQNLDFYKVGHHGSTNATPMDMVQAMRQGCVCMCSTQPGAYGSEKNKSEVPRIPLMTALGARSGGHLARSDQLVVAGLDPSENLSQALDAVFTPQPAQLCIDYEV